MGLVVLFLVAAVLIVLIGAAGIVYRMTHPLRKTFGAAVAGGLATDLTEAGLRGCDITFTFHDGSTSPGWLVEGDDPDGAHVVVTHGWSNSRYGALTKAQLLAPMCAKVVVYDLRAHGDSTGATCHQSATEVGDLLAVVEQSYPDGRPVVLFGSSFGSGISLVAAGRNGDQRIRGVICDGPYRFGMDPVARHLRDAGVPGGPTAVFVWLAGLWLGVRYGLLRGFDRVEHAKKLRCPLLVLHGSDDPLCEPTSGRAIAGAAADGELVMIEGGGHGGLMQVDPIAYRGAIEAFLKKVCQLPESCKI